jgi:hypothetical protein
VEQRDLFVEGQLGDDQVGALVGGEAFVHPWTGGFRPRWTELGSGATEEGRAEDSGECDLAQAGKRSGVHRKGE